MLAKINPEEKDYILHLFKYRDSAIKKDVKENLGRVYKVFPSPCSSDKFYVQVKGPSGRFTSLGHYFKHWFLVSKYSPMEKYYDVS